MKSTNTTKNRSVASSARRSRRGITLIDVAVLIAATTLLAALALPVLAQVRGNDWAAVTRDHLRQYTRAHLVYVADHDVMPPLGRGDTDGVPLSPAWVTEVGVFSTNHDGLVIDLDAGLMLLMNGFFENYITDPTIFTSPADTMVRHTPPGTGLNNRAGNFLTPDEDPQAVGATFARLWFNFSWPSLVPSDYREITRTLHAIGDDGDGEAHVARLLRADAIQSPADSVNLVEEDEISFLNNSVFTTTAWQQPPFPPGTSNVITDRHSGGGHVSFFDGHVELFDDVVKRYWEQPDQFERVRLLWRTFVPEP